MKIIKIVPGHEPVMADIDNTLKALQKAVGGYVETCDTAAVPAWCGHRPRGRPTAGSTGKRCL